MYRNANPELKNEYIEFIIQDFEEEFNVDHVSKKIGVKI
jgi:hypothetical protein